CMQAMQLLTF
nr:immunoglobulin light chain junction region [Macaca mulatta]MOW45105.1 immunoglobulin light chain junction region [Macaca mulatta]